MNVRMIVSTALLLIVVSLCLTVPVSAHKAGADHIDGVEAQQKGRYKKDGDNCVWDANDTGPNQCTPQVTGRFKKDGDKCVWDARDKGPDQCTPTGRWKKDGNRCVWADGDTGPNQCNPRQPR
jgi:hypothetical protein